VHGKVRPHCRGLEAIMRIDKAQVLDIMRDLGKDTSVAQRDLPDPVDTDEHAELLGRFGISAGELLEQFGGADTGRGRAPRDADGTYPADAHEQFAEGLPAGTAALRGIGGVGGLGH
jgi:hypothetical protein